MHEMSLCEGVIQIIESQAAVENYQRVKTVWLEIGLLSGVEIEAIKFCFEVVCRNSIAENSVLVIIELPGKAWCIQCSKNINVDSRHSACPDCGSYQLQVSGGDEMKIKELEVE
ncbi:MAG: hydrogenase maturation nickel metallochaperone HypA [Porticoccus sp.]|nr:hydrogenase maturation nickel metallochaperone HypA [Porticoccus sp.]